MSRERANPYKTAPDRAFWSRSVSQNYSPGIVANYDRPLIGSADKVVSAGSCFASNLVPYLNKAGFEYVRTEGTHEGFEEVSDDTFGYQKFSAAYGNIYTVRQLVQLLRRCLGTFSPVESFWVEDGEYIDPYRPGLKFRARSIDEFHALTQQHLRKTLEAFKSATVFVLTLGLTEAWRSKQDGAIFPACPGTIAGSFNPEIHEYYNLSAGEIVDDLNTFIRELREINPTVRLILTVSPVPLVATASDRHVLSASIYSKSVLRVAAEEAIKANTDVTYFPAYEIVTGPQAPESYFAADRRNVTPDAVGAVMSSLLAACDCGEVTKVSVPQSSATSNLSTLLIEAECEEAMSDR